MTAPASPIIGIISPPAWYDPTASELEALVQEPIRTQQTILPLPRFAFDDLQNIAGAEPHLVACAELLGEVGVDLVAMPGTPFVWAGLSREDELEARIARLSQAAGSPAVMAGGAVLDAIRALGARRVAIAAPYYTKPWKAHVAKVFAAFGVEILTLQAADDAGQSAPLTSVDDHESVSGEATVLATVRAVHAAAPDADAVILLGAGVRTLAHLPALEAEFGKPFIASDTALFWAICKALQLTPKPGHLGRMGDDLTGRASS